MTNNNNTNPNWIDSEFSSAWISNQITESCINYTSKFGEYLAKNGLTTSQIRNIFGEIKRIQMNQFSENKTAFLLLRPKMAYAAKRANTNGATEFEKVMKLAHDAVASGTDGDSKRFENFCDFVEAILAYHKAAGGRD